MFTQTFVAEHSEVLFIIAPKWIQTKWPSTDTLIVIYSYNRILFSNEKEKKKKALQRKKQTRIQRMGRQEGRDDLSDESLQLAGGGGRWTGRTEAKAWVEKEQGL